MSQNKKPNLYSIVEPLFDKSSQAAIPEPPSKEITATLTPIESVNHL